MNIFGYEIKRKGQEPISFVPKVTDDGAVVVAEGGTYGTYVDLDGSVRNEAELINKYREMAEYPEVDMAIDDIVNEMVVQDPTNKIVELILDDYPQTDKVKKAINSEFDNVLNLLEFEDTAYDIARRWYVDGRLYYHSIIDESNPQEGIKELRYIDPRKIRKIREVEQKRADVNFIASKTKKEYYMFNDSGFGKISGANAIPSNQAGGIRIAKDSIIHCTSGLTTMNNDMVLSYLQKAIRPLNQLRTMEDSLVIYRISRAPERRIFYIDVGNLPKIKAEQYLKDLMTKFKNKLVYDSATGEVRDDRKFMTMLEDFWLPRREGGKGTEITTLPGGQNLGDLDDVLYFQKKLYQSLNVPVGRLDPDAQFNFGRATEITRDEIKFAKFITKLRGKFTNLFAKILEKQLILKGILAPEEWDQFKNNIRFKFAKDVYFEELKNAEILRDRLATLQQAEPYIGKALSWEWCMRHILLQSDEEIEEIAAQNEAERQNPFLYPPEMSPEMGQAPGQEQPQDLQ